MSEDCAGFDQVHEIRAEVELVAVRVYVAVTAYGCM